MTTYNLINQKMFYSPEWRHSPPVQREVPRNKMYPRWGRAAVGVAAAGTQGVARGSPGTPCSPASPTPPSSSRTCWKPQRKSLAINLIGRTINRSEELPLFARFSSFNFPILIFFNSSLFHKAAHANFSTSFAEFCEGEPSYTSKRGKLLSLWNAVRQRIAIMPFLSAV